jgi:large subunit ribosomal protein L21
MYAVIETGGKQYLVTPGTVLEVEKLAVQAGGTVEFDRVLLVGEQGQIRAGAPLVDKAKVVAEVVDQVKGDKIRVFKFKRRKAYRRTQGHRQALTRLRIREILA